MKQSHVNACLPATARSRAWLQTLLAATMLTPFSLAPAFGQAAAPAASAPATPAPAAPAATPAAAPEGGPKQVTPGNTPVDAVRVLLQQANYWRSENQSAKAAEALNRVLLIEPQNADALATLAQVQAEQGHVDAAKNALSRLQAIRADDPRIPAISQALRVGPIDTSQLNQARTLAKQGRNGDAVSQYQRVFKGNPPPPSYATEYYSVLSGTNSGWDQARNGLASQVTANPQDLKAQLAYAELLTYREDTRVDGIRRLNQLTANPTTAAEANTALRQALLWLPANASSIAPLQSYAERHANDAEITQRLEAARHPPQTGPVDESGRLRVTGYSDLNRGQLNQAASQFEAAIARNPNDGDALGGLGVVRLRQGRTADARRLLERAIQADPSKRRQWQAALAGANTSDGPNVGRQWDDVRRLADRGDYAAAESRLRPLLGPNQSNTGGLLLLGDIQQRAGEYQAAESTYRTVLNRQPNNAAAVLGLAAVLSRSGRSAEAEQLYARAETLGARGIGQARAAELRARAEAVPDPAAKAGLYRAAVAADPTNPWLKLELARTLARQNRLPEARAVMSGVGDGTRPSRDALEAGLIFANETGDVATASALISRVPPRDRTADMQRAIETAKVKADIASAAELFNVNRPVSRERLLAIAAASDTDGVHGAEVARAFLAMGDRLGAREAISTAMAANRMPTPAARLAYSGVLLDAGQTDAAAAVAGSVNPGSVAGPQRTALTQLQSGIAVRAADQLNAQGRTADAYDRLAPALARTPADPSLNMALGRLYETNNQPGQAMAINEELLRRDPGNLDVRRAAVGSAIQASEYTRAERLVQDALQMTPNDPRVWVMSADLAKARGNNGRALHDYQVARDLRRQQLAGGGFGADTSSSLPVSTPGPAPAPNVLTAPPAGLPYSPLPPIGNAPAPVDAPRRGYGRTSERDEPKRQQDAEAEAPPVSGPMPRVELAQATLPYYVSPAPPLSTASQPVTGTSAVPGLAPNAAGYGAGGFGSSLSTPPGLTTYGYNPASPPTYGSIPIGNVGSGYANPFRPGDAGIGSSLNSPNPLGPAYAAPAAPVDQLSADIDQNIASLRGQLSPKVQGGFGFRVRSGASGLDHLTEEFVPIEGSFSPAGVGELKLQVTPTFIQGGTIGSDPATLARFGSLPLYALSPDTPRPGSQNANGVGLDVSYGWKWVTADIGSTPVGFREQNIIGGVELSPQITDTLRLRITGERRAVTDSVLSYAGTVDTRTGQTFGGVTRTRGHLQLEYGGKDGLNLYAGGGYASLDGDNVQSNNEWEAGIGGSYPVYRGANDELRVGLDLVYFGYERNLDFFTLGGGGYFSPQSYFAALVPVTYRQTIDKLTWSVGASVGFQTYHANGSPIFPGNQNGLQDQLTALAANNPNLALYYNAQNDTGFAGGAQAEAEYKITPSFSVGGRGGFQHTGNFTEGGGLVYARYTFGGSQ